MSNVNLNESWRRMAKQFTQSQLMEKYQAFYDLDMTEVNEAIERWNLNTIPILK